MDSFSIDCKKNRINDRLCDVYREFFDEVMDVAKEKGIGKIVIGFHDIDVPFLVFEDREGNHKYEALSEMSFNIENRWITLIGAEGDSAYLDEYWGEHFNVEKIGEIYSAFVEVVYRDGLKEIEMA